MKPRGLLVCLCLLLAGCAARNQAPLAPGQVDLALNVEGGKYQRIAMPLAENDNGIVDLTLERINDDPNWGALVNLCVQADPHSDQVCLRFHSIEAGSQQLQAKLVTVTEDGRKLLTSEDLPGSFVVGEAIRTDLHVSPGSVKFRINGGQPITRTLPFSPRVLTLGCSSAVCKARMT
jgi:hypothetical protein